MAYLSAHDGSGPRRNLYLSERSSRCNTGLLHRCGTIICRTLRLWDLESGQTRAANLSVLNGGFRADVVSTRCRSGNDRSPTSKVFFALSRGRRGTQRALNSVSCLLLYLQIKDVAAGDGTPAQQAHEFFDRVRRSEYLAREPYCYPKDIAIHKLAARKKTSLNMSRPVDQRLLLIACRRCPSMTLSRSAMSG